MCALCTANVMWSCSHYTSIDCECGHKRDMLRILFEWGEEELNSVALTDYRSQIVHLCRPICYYFSFVLNQQSIEWEFCGSGCNHRRTCIRLTPFFIDSSAIAGAKENRSLPLGWWWWLRRLWTKKNKQTKHHGQNTLSCLNASTAVAGAASVPAIARTIKI